MPKINLDLTDEELKKVKEILPDKFEEDKRLEPEPECGKEYWIILSGGKLFSYVWTNCEEDKMNWKQGNCYPTEKDAEMASLRQKSESYREKITGEYFWVWDWADETPKKTIDNRKVWTTDIVFNTKEACQRWYDRFGKAWEYLWENNK